jgi:FkbM family methyltransferase
MSKLKDLLAKLLRLRKVVFGVDCYIKQDLTLPTKTFGNNGFSWTLVPELLNESSVVYSFGVGNDISFDLALINHVDVCIYAFDPTPEVKEWVSNKNLPKQFLFNSVGLADYDGKAKFYPPINPGHISASMLERKETKNLAYKVDVRSLKSILDELGHKQIDLLKMDIEGAEYAVINSMKKANILPKKLLVEFHHQFKNVGVKKTISAVKKLHEMGYQVFHVSESGKRTSFIHKSYIDKIKNIQ